MSESETSEYIMGQVRSIACIMQDLKLQLEAGNIGMAKVLTEQLVQDNYFLHACLKKHPRYTPGPA